eukprot:m.46237 g.46237  ORF g.46237 m.46237 type:complete len:81 (+) comp12231_c0_seq5:1824-2066(+)
MSSPALFAEKILNISIQIRSPDTPSKPLTLAEIAYEDEKQKPLPHMERVNKCMMHMGHGYCQSLKKIVMLPCRFLMFETI